MEDATENCNRCESVVYNFSKNVAISNNSSYCVKCAEELDMNYLAKNVCSVCTNLLNKDEIKFVMPSRLYSDYFFDRLPLENRLMCVTCYRKASRLNIIRQPLTKIAHIRVRLAKKIVKRSVVRNSSIIRNK